MSACTTEFQFDKQPKAKAAKHSVIALALWNEPVFDRDVTSFANAYQSRFGQAAHLSKFGYASPKIVRPEDDVLAKTIEKVAAQSADGKDIIVFMATSHGTPEHLAIKPFVDQDSLLIPAHGISDLLQPLQNDLQIIILQACFSGSLIDDLAHPNRIIITAASANKTSFGCAPKETNTWFIESLNQAFRIGGSWQDIFANTRTLVAKKEASEGIDARDFSDPQAFVGENMKLVWGDMS